MLKAEPSAAVRRPRRLIPGMRGLALLTIFAVLLLPSAAGAATVRARVNSPDGLNLRASPSSNADIVTLLPLGTIVDVLGSQSDDGWNEVNAGSRHGYVKAQYLDVIPTTTESTSPLKGDAQVIPNDGVHLRAGPSLAAPVVALLPAGRVVHIQGEPLADGWYPVVAAEGTGFVLGTYLQTVSGDATPILIRWYGHDFDGGRLACGGTFSADDDGIAATTTYPCGTNLKVCARGNCVNVVVRDQGRMGPGALDLSAAAFQRLGSLDAGALQGTAQVTVQPAASTSSGH